MSSKESRASTAKERIAIANELISLSAKKKISWKKEETEIFNYMGSPSPALLFISQVAGKSITVLGRVGGSAHNIKIDNDLLLHWEDKGLQNLVTNPVFSLWDIITEARSPMCDPLARTLEEYLDSLQSLSIEDPG